MEQGKEEVNMKEVARNPEESEPQGPIGIEIGAIAALIATGYSGVIERTYTILDKEVVVTFDIPSNR